jgi:uncharacterized membrane protein
VPFVIMPAATNQARPPEFPTSFWIGLIVAMVPLLYLTVCWILSFAFIIDGGVRFWPAMELSRKLVNLRLGSWILFFIVNGLMSIAGICAFCVGLFVVVALLYCALAVVYEEIITGRPAGAAAEA